MILAKIVIISDDWVTTDLWSQVVKQQGNAVDLVDLGVTSYILDSLHLYDLAIVDINNYDTGGADVCRRVRSASDIHLLVLTGEHDERVHLHLYRNGADECIAKPIGPALLHAKIGAWLRRRTRRVPIWGQSRARTAY